MNISILQNKPSLSDLILPSLLLLLLISGCKSQEEIKQEQMIENMSMQMVQNQKLAAELTVRVQSLEQKLNVTTGQLEEQGHEKDQSFNKKMEELQAAVKLQSEKQTNLVERSEQDHDEMLVLKQELVDQKSFVEQVLKTLKKITGKSKQAKLSTYDRAMKNYRKGRYKTANPLLGQLYKNKKIKGNKRARVIHNLGMIAFMNKKHADASTYFSKLYVKFPNAPYLANGLYYLGLSFQKLNKNENAIQIYKTLIKKFPKSNSSKKAKKSLDKLTQ